MYPKSYQQYDIGCTEDLLKVICKTYRDNRMQVALPTNICVGSRHHRTLLILRPDVRLPQEVERVVMSAGHF